jgi:signal peptidase II
MLLDKHEYGGRLSIAVTAAAIAVACFIADQLSKGWALCALSASMYTPFIPGLLRLVLVSNSGGAFGIAHGNNSLLALLASTIMIGVLAWAAWREKSGHHLNTAQWCGVGFLIGGAFGNLWDRLLLGHVTDFLDFALISFPVFNLSDVFVDIGIGLILLGAMSAERSRV